MTPVLDDAARAAAERVRRVLGPIRELALAGSGLDFCVFRGEHPGYGTVAIRTPRARMICNDNDPPLDARDLLVQEAELARHARDHGLPAPRVHELVRDDDGDLLLSEFVAGDGSPIDGAELGRLARRLHAMPLPIYPLPHARAVLVERIARRARAVERITGTALGLPAPERLADALPAAACGSVLHMDLRAGNAITRGGAIVALVDWANALQGWPLLELARVAEYGALDDGFADGYDLVPAASPAWSLYRLDTAVMLAVVFLSEAPDQDRAAAQLQRIRDLADDLR